jgi:hypothetical protein
MTPKWMCANKPNVYVVPVSLVCTLVWLIAHLEITIVNCDCGFRRGWPRWLLLKERETVKPLVETTTAMVQKYGD